MHDEAVRVPAIEKRLAGQIGKGEPGLAVRTKEFHGAAALRRKFLKWRERCAVPSHQTRRAGVVCIAQEMLPVLLEMNPVITPAAVKGLKLDESIAIPLKNTGAAWIPRHRPLDGHTLCQREKVPVTDFEMMPLLRGEGWKSLKGVPALTAAPVEYGIGIKVIRTGTGSNAGGCEIVGIVDLEGECVLSARYRQPPVLDEPAPRPAIQQHVDIAVAAVHVGRRAGDILRQLGYGQPQLAAAMKRQNGACAGGGKALMLGEQSCAPRRINSCHVSPLLDASRRVRPWRSRPTMPAARRLEIADSNLNSPK